MCSWLWRPPSFSGRDPPTGTALRASEGTPRPWDPDPPQTGGLWLLPQKPARDLTDLRVSAGF